MRILGSHALVLVLGGRGFYVDAMGTRADLKAGDALLLSPDRAHAYGPADGEPWEQIYAVFDGPQFELLQASEVFRAHQPRWHVEPVDLWRRRLEELFQPVSGRPAVVALQTLGRFVELLIAMAANDAEGRRDPDEAWLEESLRLLGEPQGGRWIHPEEVARMVGLSYENFRKRFAARVETAPGQFQQQRRIDLACAAIYRGEDSFKSLAAELGFCDVYHFSKVFRRQMGVPPSAYRRRVRGG